MLEAFEIVSADILVNEAVAEQLSHRLRDEHQVRSRQRLQARCQIGGGTHHVGGAAGGAADQRQSGRDGDAQMQRRRRSDPLARQFPNQGEPGAHGRSASSSWAVG